MQIPGELLLAPNIPCQSALLGLFHIPLVLLDSAFEEMIQVR